MLHYQNTDIIELGGDLNCGITYENLLTKIATYIYVMAAYETQSGNRVIYCEEIEKQFGLEDGWIDEQIADDIQGELNKHFQEMIAEIELYFERGGYDEEAGYYKECDRYFDITLYTNFAVGILEEDPSIEYNL